MANISQSLNRAVQESKRLLLDQIANAVEAGDDVDIEQLRHQSLAAGVSMADLVEMVELLTERYRRFQELDSRDFYTEIEAATKARDKAAAEFSAAEEGRKVALQKHREALDANSAASGRLGNLNREQDQMQRDLRQYLAQTGDRNDWRIVNV